MKQKFKSILLVDDDPSTNFLHQHFLQEWGVTEKIFVAENGKEAIDFLASTPSFLAENPSLILLDINMPVMDGFEFLDKYEKLPPDMHASILVVMLTSSLHERDKKRAEIYKSLKGFLHKPLTEEDMRAIFTKLGAVKQMAD